MTVKVAYIGWIGRHNIGDEACLAAISKMLGKKFKLTPIDQEWKKQTPDLCILGGGTLLDTRFGRREKSLLLPMMLKKVPIVMWGTGVVDLYNGNIHSTVIDILNYADYVGIRGPISRKALSIRGFDKAVVIGDPALLLKSTGRRTKKSKPHIAINVGTTNNNLYGTEKHVVQQCNTLLALLKEDEVDISMFSVWPKDNQMVMSLAKKHNVNCRLLRYIHKDFREVYSMLDFMKTCDCVVGMKLHSCVLSVAAKTPFISLAYRKKCLDFAKSIGLLGWCVKTNSSWGATVRNKIRISLDNSKRIKSRMEKFTGIYRQAHNKLARDIKRKFA